MSLLAMISLKTGRALRWDGEHRRILDDADSSALLRRDYRKPWEYPTA